MKLIERFHRDDSAQISFLAVAGAICFIGLVSMVINTNDIITDRVHMQDVADTTAVSAAAWTARGLNMISFINVMNTKLISTAVLLNALADTIPAVQAVGEVQYAIFQACSAAPFVGAICAAYAAVIRVQLSALSPINTAVSKLANSLSRCSGSAALWKLMKALEAAATVITNTFTGIGIAESIEMAKANGATFGLVVSGKILNPGGGGNPLALPVTKAKFPAHCPYVKNGGSGYAMAGYTCGEGPFKLGKKRIEGTILLPFINLFSRPIFRGMAANHFGQIGCQNDPGDEDNKFKVTLSDLPQCRKHGATSKWARMVSRTQPLEGQEFANLTVQNFAPWKPLREDNSSGGGDDAPPDLGTVQDQIGDINVTPGDLPPAGSTQQVTFGSAYELLQESTEQRRQNLDVPCGSGRGYPFYTPPGGGLDDYAQGSISRFCSPFAANCRRIDQVTGFRWYSGSHAFGGSETAGGYFIRVGKRTIPGNEEENIPEKYQYMVETVSLVSAGEKEMTQDEFEQHMKDNGKNVNTNASNSSTGSGCQKPEPYVLDNQGSQKQEEFQDKLRFIGFVYRDIRDDQPFWSNYFSTPPKVMIGYSQAQVYNHLAEDTFTQDWRVRLEQASLLESLLGSGRLGGMAPVTNSVLGSINNH